MEKRKSYITFTRDLEGYAWYKPILVLLLAFFFQTCASVILAVLYFLIKVNNGLTLMDAADILSGGYDTMDVYSPEGALYMLGSLAAFVPAIWLASLIVKNRKFSTYGSVCPGFDIKLFGKMLLAGIVPVAIPVAIFTIYGADYTGEIKFTVLGFIVCTALTLFQCIAEEYVFRGLIMQTVGGWTRNVIIAIIIQAVIFASGHPYSIYGVIEVFIAGILLGTVAHITDGLEASSAAHFLNNITIFWLNGFGFQTISTEVEFMSIIESTFIDGLFLIVVIILIKKGILPKRQAQEQIQPAEGPVFNEVNYYRNEE